MNSRIAAAGIWCSVSAECLSLDFLTGCKNHRVSNKLDVITRTSTWCTCDEAIKRACLICKVSKLHVQYCGSMDKSSFLLKKGNLI